jgi:hypothetical protein
MTESAIQVQIDNRIRLLAAILALTTWPEQEQAYKPHGVHAHARATRAALAAVEDHPAVLAMQELLESGLTLDAIFSYAACLNWPGLRIRGKQPPEWAPQEWSTLLRNFAHEQRITALWGRDGAAWDEAEASARRALAAGGDPRAMLGRLFGPLDVALIFVPNLCYPTAETLCFRDEERLVCVSPPPVAWGTNPPWPYDDNPADTAREAFSAYARLLLVEHLAAHPLETEAVRKTQLPVPNVFLARHPTWFDQFSALIVSAATALYLRETFGKAEADAYTVMTHKAHGFDSLPTVMQGLENYFEAQARGRVATFVEYLPLFIRGFRVAERLKGV